MTTSPILIFTVLSVFLLLDGTDALLKTCSNSAVTITYSPGILLASSQYETAVGNVNFTNCNADDGTTINGVTIVFTGNANQINCINAYKFNYTSEIVFNDTSNPLIVVIESQGKIVVPGLNTVNVLTSVVYSGTVNQTGEYNNKVFSLTIMLDYITTTALIAACQSTTGLTTVIGSATLNVT